MKPIYFPFTFISKNNIPAVCSCFPQIVVYQPTGRHMTEHMQILADKGMIEPRCPISTNDETNNKSDDEKIDRLCKDYRDWIHIHQGTTADLLKARPGKTPFFDDFSVFQIRDTIRKKESNQPVEKPEPLLNARLFLQLTQEFDEQESDIHQDFQNCNSMEKNLFQAIKGEDEFISDKTGNMHNDSTFIYDQGKYMTGKRIDAWSRLVLQDQKRSGLYVTTSQAVIEQMTDNFPEAENILTFDSIPVPHIIQGEFSDWQNDLAKHLHLIIKDGPSVSKENVPSPPDTPCSQKASLTVFLIPGQTPDTLFDRSNESGLTEIKKMACPENINHTLFALIEC